MTMAKTRCKRRKNAISFKLAKYFFRSGHGDDDDYNDGDNDGDTGDIGLPCKVLLQEWTSSFH